MKSQIIKRLVTSIAIGGEFVLFLVLLFPGKVTDLVAVPLFLFTAIAFYVANSLVPERVWFAWYDIWVGLYWDRKKRILYICPLPMLVIAVYFPIRWVLPHKKRLREIELLKPRSIVDGILKIPVTAEEMSHLIGNAPFNHVISAGMGSGMIDTTWDSWEYQELLRLRVKKADEER
jgi:hypothetical protein